MRLTESQVEAIKQLVSRAFESQPNYQLWLFGSRVDDELKGGDVDLCVIADLSPEYLLETQLRLRPEIEEAIDLTTDLVMQSLQRPLKKVSQQAVSTGVRLV
jgi:predicted nucleotidyltransferase